MTCFGLGEAARLIELSGSVLVKGSATRTSQQDEAALFVGCDLRDVAKEAIVIVRAVLASVVHGSGPEDPTGKATQPGAPFGHRPLKVHRGVVKLAFVNVTAESSGFASA